MPILENKTVLEKYMLPDKHWADGYRYFSRLFGKPLGWLYAFQDGKGNFVRLNQKGNCSFYAKSAVNELGCIGFLTKYFDQLRDNPEKQKELPYFYKCAYGRAGAVFGITNSDQLKGFLVLCTIKKNQRDTPRFLTLFNQFLQTQAELAYKNFELQNVYETVHPRVLALSSMHSVNRIISSSLHLKELLPQIGRLFTQVIKANDCSIYFVDPEAKFLVPKFVLSSKKVIAGKPRIQMGKGIEGHVAETAEFYLTKKCMCIPIIGEDVIGVISLKNKSDRNGFAAGDLEIFKSLCEQAVVAIRNAKLFDEAEQLTINSIQVINELLDFNYAGSNARLPLFGELVFEIAKDLKLSSSEITSLHRATFLIDTGHLTMPERIFKKESNLTKLEYNQIKKHPKIGAKVLEKMGVLAPVIPIILHHHERYDGAGYPDGLKGEAIPIGARIVSVADAFTAMLMCKPYRKSKTPQEAIEEIKKNSSTQFDPHVVSSFLRVVEIPEIVKKINRLIDKSLEKVRA